MTYYNPKKSALAERQKGSVALVMTMIFSLFLLSVFYLAQANSIVAKNFQLRAAQSLLKEKQNANQQAIIALTQAKSMINLENAAKVMNLVAVEKVEYLKVSPETFALLQQP